MDYNITYIKYEVLNNDQIIVTGNCPSFFLNSLTDAYCDFKNSPYHLRIYYKDKIYLVNSPIEFHNEDIF